MNLPPGVTKIEGFVADPEALFERLMADTSERWTTPDLASA